MEGGKLGTDNGFAQNFALQQVMKRTRYRLGSGKRMNTPMQKKVKSREWHTLKTQNLLRIHGKIDISPQTVFGGSRSSGSGSSGSAPASSQTLTGGAPPSSSRPLSRLALGRAACTCEADPAPSALLANEKWCRNSPPPSLGSCDHISPPSHPVASRF